MTFKNYIRFTDTVNLKPLISDEVKDQVEDYFASIKSGQPITQPLNIRIAATHAGKITRNNSFYLPDKMRKGAATFVDQYKKPIQVHHESRKDPVGRVLQAKYVDTSQAFRNGFRDSFTVSVDRGMSDFVSGSMSRTDIIDWACKYFINDLTISEDPGYEGLGYIELLASITDPDAIQKILDKRYLTGSVGASTDSAVCSKCKKDWAGEDGRCDHRPGKVYDGEKCVLIAGDFIYDEWSFVNKPADTHASVIEVNINGIQDFIQLDDNKKNANIPEIHLVIDNTKISNNSTPKEAHQMLFKDAFKLVSKNDKFKDVEKLEDLVKSIVDKHKKEKLTDEQLLDLVAKEAGLELKEDKKDTDDVGRVFFGDEYDEIIGDDTEEGMLYVDMLMSLLDGIEDEEEKKETQQLIRDAALTAKQRSALPSSSFCGPDRSFPVNDCAHYTAALRLLNRFKGPGDKGRIRACILRKGKRLGCPGTTEDETSVGQFTVDFFDIYNDEELVQLADGLQLVLKDRGLECSECTETQDEVNKLQKELKDLKEAKDKTISDEAKELKDRLDTARKEIKYLHSDIENLENELADTKQLIHSNKVERIADFKRLKGEEVDISALSDELKDKATDEVDALLTDISKEVDITKITDILNSGLSNSPNEKVDDPTLKVNDSKKPLTRETLEAIRNHYIELRMNSNSQVADAYIADLKNRGVLPAQMTDIKQND